MKFSLGRRVASEFLGTAFLVSAVLGSGIMGERLTDGNVALALLANTLATGAALAALILAFGPISGAQLNPAVTLVAALQRNIRWADAPALVLAQCLGGLSGTLLTHLMFGLDWFAFSSHVRAGKGLALGEFVATFGLLLVILSCSRWSSSATAPAVACYITAAYWFTSSTSFANPAVTIARSVSDTFAGIRPADAPGFIIAQLVGALAAALVFRWLLSGGKAGPPDTLPGES